LSRLSDRLRPMVPMLSSWFHWLGLIDFIRSKALWANENKALLPTMEEQPFLDWKDARHPILEQSLAKIGKKLSL